MVLIGEMWSKLPVGRRRPVRSFVQRHRCRTASETFTRPHRKRKRAPIKIGQLSPGKNTNKNSPRTTPTKRRQRRRTPLRRPPRLLPRSGRRARAKTAARRKRWRPGVDEWSLQTYVYNLESFTRRFIYAIHRPISRCSFPHSEKRARRRTRTRREVVRVWTPNALCFMGFSRTLGSASGGPPAE